jgi:hypothetical protein
LFVLKFSGKPITVNVLPIIKSIADFSVNLPDKVESEEAIPWIADRRLAWDDFLCSPERNTDAVASTSTSLGISYKVEGNVFTYHISCDFSKYRSWGLLKTDYILAHEQGHFDITEIFARKLHKALEEYVFNPKTFKRDISTIYQTIVKEKEALQEIYDGETDHSRKRKVQMEWLIKIDELLQATEPYIDYP